MKKIRSEIGKTSKLGLSGETIRVLHAGDLQHVAGGITEGLVGTKKPL
jgi:hypothetical protein